MSKLEVKLCKKVVHDNSLPHCFPANIYLAKPKNDWQMSDWKTLVVAMETFANESNLDKTEQYLLVLVIETEQYLLVLVIEKCSTTVAQK